MNVLILEDDIHRIERFREKLHKHTLTFTDYVPDAKLLLEKFTYDYLFLDHDLDDRTYVDSGEFNTGYQLCKWMSENYTRLNLRFQIIFIHTMNPAGAQAMRDVLPEGIAEQVIVMPFHMLIDVLNQGE